ncbi:MAG: ROK family transcriptional regulator [Lachnospiraceae bacterium]|nr:ROK family transcriptional regulator [Lachnospiraceae bacterium]
MDINAIVNNTDMNEAHRSLIVKILHQKEVCSRAEIAKITGLTQASITKITASLIEMGIVYESGIIKGSGNRRAIGIRLNTENNLVIGVKFSRHMYVIGVFDIGGKFYTRTETEFDINEDPRVVLDDIKKQVHAYLKEYKNTVAIGMAVPGPYLKDEGFIAIVSRMSAWHDVNFIKEFENEFKIPFFIEQDANAGALAEWWFGNHEKPMDTLAYMLVGEGVGSGIIQGDRIFGGKQGIASEIGHISIDVNGPRCQCGNFGCLELYCAAPVLLTKAKREASGLFKKKGLKRAENHRFSAPPYF